VQPSASISSMRTAYAYDKPLPVRLPPEIVRRLDEQRGLVPRETYVRALLDEALKARERKPTKRGEV